VYGFGRKPKYYRWTVPIEHHLFVADKPTESRSAEAKPDGKGFRITHHWTQDLPLLARAMVLAGGTLFVAGPADLVDEEEAYKQIGDPKVRSSLADQVAALEGKKGATLWAVSAADGQKLAELALDAPPVFDATSFLGAVRGRFGGGLGAVLDDTARARCGGEGRMAHVARRSGP